MKALRSIATSALMIGVLFPALLTAFVGVDLNLFYGIGVIAAGTWLVWRRKGPGLLWILLAAAFLAVLPYPLWMRTGPSGALTVQWSQAIFDSHPWYYPAVFVVNAIILVCAFRLALGRWPASVSTTGQHVADRGKR